MIRLKMVPAPTQLSCSAGTGQAEIVRAVLCCAALCVADQRRVAGVRESGLMLCAWTDVPVVVLSHSPTAVTV